jgi:DNA repair exonuclease SbcCD ATPase subunit
MISKEKIKSKNSCELFPVKNQELRDQPPSIEFLEQPAAMSDATLLLAEKDAVISAKDDELARAKRMLMQLNEKFKKREVRMTTSQLLADACMPDVRHHNHTRLTCVRAVQVNLREKAQAAVATARAEAESLRQQVSDLEAAREEKGGGTGPAAPGGGCGGGGGAGGGEEDTDRIRELERQLQEAEELSQELSDAVEQRDNIIAKVRTAHTSAPSPTCV